jgi:hemerythrin
MARITWQESFSVGVEVIDSDHRLLVSLINQLEDAILGGQGCDVVAAVLRVLVDYTHSHFAREELLMRKAGYRQLEAHIKEHRALTDQVAVLVKKVNDQPEVTLDRALLDFLQHWLTDHILGADRAYAPYLQGVTLNEEEHLDAVEQPNRPPRGP